MTKRVRGDPNPAYGACIPSLMGRCNVACVGSCCVATHSIGVLTDSGVLGNKAAKSSTTKGR